MNRAILRGCLRACIAGSSMERRIGCRWEGATVTLGMEEAGSGSSVVLLPALSSISTRAEMRPLFDSLASNFHVTTVDWPGFGDLPRPRADWSPDALSAFLNWFLSEVSPGPHALVAAGHAATYALYHAVSLSCRVLSRCRSPRSHCADMARSLSHNDGLSSLVCPSAKGN
jgi:Alpha/beta hydrolase family